MRKNFGAKTWIFPQPVLMIATYDEKGVPDCMNAAWGGITDYNKISIALASDHKTTKNILLKKAFTVSSATRKYVKECDYLGIVSGNDVSNKLELCNFHTKKSEFVDAPIIEELPLTLECKLISIDPETEIVTGEIVNVSVEESILTEGKIDPEKLEAISYDSVNFAYLLVKEKVGNAFKDGKALKK